jgi:integrase
LKRAKNYKSNGIKAARAASVIEKKDLKRIKDSLKAKNVRDYVIFSFNLNLGLRASDLLTLKTSDVYSEKWIPLKTLIIREKKTGKVRELTLNKTARDILREYRKEYKNLLTLDGYLFPSQKKNQGNGHLTISSFDRILRKANNRAKLNIKYSLSSHSIRKTFGTELFENNVPIDIIQQVFGHANPQTTLIYINVNKKQVSNAYQKIKL